MASTSDADALRGVGWLSRTPSEFQDAVILRSELIELSQGSNLYNAGDEPGGVYGVLEGQIELHLPALHSHRSLGYIASVGFWVGDLAAVRGHERLFSVVARGSCRLLRLSRPDLQRICTEEPTSWKYVSADSLGLAVDVIDVLRTRNALVRIAKFVLILANGGRGPTAAIHVSLADLAELALLSRASTNAALATLEGKGWIRRGYASLEIVNLPALADFCGAVGASMPTGRSRQ